MKTLRDLFRWFRDDKKEDTNEVTLPNPLPSNNLAIIRHQKRIDNLAEELHQISKQLVFVESNPELTKNEREKQSDNLIRRITLIKYEIDIREDLIKWLS